MTSYRVRARTGVVISLIAILPLTLLLVRWHTGFISDWHVNLWMVGQVSSYFKAHGTFPIVFNSNSSVGLVAPVFYGHLLYPFLGLLGAMTTPNAAIRIACVLVYLLQGSTVYLACYAVSRQRTLSFTITATVLWAIYPLSNLYNRGALAEFFAVALLQSAVCCWVLFVFSVETAQRVRWGFAFSFLLAWMFGTHPITALYGSILIAFAVLAFTTVNPPPRIDRTLWIGTLAFAAGLVLLTSAPWLDAYRRFGGHLAIVEQLTRLQRSEGLDSWWIRILPFPFDYRALLDGQAVQTAYLDTQVNLPLLILLCGVLTETCLVLGWRSLADRSMLAAVACLALAVFVVVASVSLWIELRLSPLFRSFQIAYRLVAYANLLLFLAMLFAIQRGSRSGVVSELTSRRWLAFRTAAVTMSVCALLAKLLHGTVLLTEHPLPNDFVLADYAVTDGLPKVDSRNFLPDQGVMFQVNSAEAFGDPAPLTLDLQAGSLLRTNVYPFPWNHILENGAPVGLERLAVSNRAPFLVYTAGTTGPVELSFSVEPPRLWLLLRNISTAAFWVGFAVFVGLPVNALFRSRHRGRQSLTGPQPWA